MCDRNVLICCTGSVATIKVPLLITYLENMGEMYFGRNPLNGRLCFRIIMTSNAFHFCPREEIPGNIKIFEDKDEWDMWKKRGDPVLHIELSKWAEVLVIAPLDANTLAKIATGICDNLLTCTLRAWDIRKPLIFCPAMNTKMYNHPITETQIHQLKKWGYHEVKSISKTLMCGDTGLGAMAEVNTIGDKVLDALKFCY